MQSAALTTLLPSDLAPLGGTLETDPPKLRVRPEPLVLDPTARIGERHRKHSHQRGYRITAVAAGIAFLAACCAIALLLMDRLTLARLVAVGAVVVAVGAVQLTRTSPLAARLRGYAIASAVLATVALAINLAGHMVLDVLNETKTTVPGRARTDVCRPLPQTADCAARESPGTITFRRLGRFSVDPFPNRFANPQPDRYKTPMREERGQISGDVVVYEPYTLWGTVGGKVTVVDGGKFYLRGSIYGDLIVEHGGRVHIFGNILGSLTLHAGTKVIHSGTIGHDIHNLGGRLLIEKASKIGGKVKTQSGRNQIRRGRGPEVHWHPHPVGRIVPCGTFSTILRNAHSRVGNAD